MGWSGGTDIAQGVWKAVKKYIPEEKKKEVATKIVVVDYLILRTRCF